MSTRFGIFILPVVPTDSADDAQSALRAAVEDVEMAEHAGFETAWVAEHHGTRYGGVCPTSMMLLAYLAGRTSRLRLCTAVSVLPLHDPVRLAEEALLLDQLTRGRLEVGVGQGFLAVDFATLGVDMASRHERFKRGLEFMRSALGHGRSANIPRIYPSRFQVEAIPMWGAAATSVESISLFANAGLHLMLNPYTRSPKEVATAIAIYREKLTAAGHPALRARVLIHEHLYAAETEDLAREVPRPYLMSYLDSLREASREAAGENRTEHGAGPERYDELFPQRVAFGTARQLRERISRWIEAGVTDFAFSIRFGGMPSHLVQRSANLFSIEVAPHFRQSEARAALV
jgi:alkanesulfonate monooxygenase SsuD/methylene tetrahydromethanopterin reductase-like flavin-dependent oxidoreductase (luciferase family)